MLYNIISKKNLKDLANLLFGSLVLAIGINLFIVPHNLAFGGVTGVTIIIQSLSGFPIFASNLFLSVVIIFLGWIELGHGFMIKTIIPTLILPLFLFLTNPLTKLVINLPISAVLGGVTIGIGIGLTMLAGGSTAGPDTIALVLKNHFRIPITLTMLAIDLSVILCGYRVYGVETAAWSIGVAFLMNMIVKVMRGILSPKYFFDVDRNIDNKIATLKRKSLIS